MSSTQRLVRLGVTALTVVLLSGCPPINQFRAIVTLTPEENATYQDLVTEIAAQLHFSFREDKWVQHERYKARRSFKHEASDRVWLGVIKDLDDPRLEFEFSVYFSGPEGSADEAYRLVHDALACVTQRFGANAVRIKKPLGWRWKDEGPVTGTSCPPQ